ncbi:Sodium/hydrogen exchanger [Ophiobolus disseminans]|uniref:Sodium/hydrogen exchanger n=1 Tax=Ophiobolus disseminans TaxID=1469910 RepID=A0A6A6ZSC8_9PLEO|nr:Sodium/hydrogen exchanger [Ophiobolus disseminans]
MAGEAPETTSSLPYHEPGIVTILVQTSFLLLLNVVNAALDRLLYCGLLGQVLIGIAWGTPGAKWLSSSVEETIVQLGYLGLILLVYEGGLHTSFQSLKANLLLSSGVALTGIAVPIGLSYTLQELLNATPVQAFAAGAALCSTSLGTTFTVLNSSGLTASRLGVVLTSAAMMDDVVGLVMVQIISNLGGDDFSWVTVVRPVLVSVAFAVVAPLACLLFVKPATLRLNRYRAAHTTARINHLLGKSSTVFGIHTLLLIGLVTAATYAGTSNLFAAYIAGAVISWWDSEVPHPEMKANEGGHVHDGIELRGPFIYQTYYHPSVSRILQPLFFASVGFSIPITRMFRGSIVWRGIVYTILMAFGKLVCGLWLVRFSVKSKSSKGTASRLLSKAKLPPIPHLWGRSERVTPSTQAGANATPTPTTATEPTPSTSTNRQSSADPAKPFSLHPPLVLAFAMCARGEIGFLISGVAESNGIFSASGAVSNEPSDIFLVVTWAIVLCTIFGPLGVGLSVRRVKKLQERKNSEQEGGGRDVLGVWGVE